MNRVLVKNSSKRASFREINLTNVFVLGIEYIFIYICVCVGERKNCMMFTFVGCINFFSVSKLNVTKFLVGKNILTFLII